ncbi:MAG: methyltransferase domain-containing protein [Methylobacteriaceae bacterium]|nr:methyltransferase domain-containing protein [Methylobacteriaceae bacterium]
MTDGGFSSGDLIADRRFAWGAAAAREGDHAAAAELFEQTLEIAPRFAAAWFALAEAREAGGAIEAARAAYARTCELAPDDPFGAGARLARLDGATPAGHAPAYVRKLFDDYAPRFDAHLTGALAYRGPELLRAAVEARGARRFARALDLGCGTGLAGLAFADLADRLEGVDLSPAMIEAARARGLYARLEAGEIVAFLAAEAAASADLALAADVFVYLGDLAPVFSATARALAPGGLIAFTTQAIDAGTYRLLDDLRFGHAPDYLRARLEAAGFADIAIEAASTRRDRGVDTPGLVATAVRA